MKTEPVFDDAGKNRQRDDYSFANVNLLGKCNVRCFFCLGEDIPHLLCQHNQLNTHYNDWKNWQKFLGQCRQKGIKKIYITGQNTDSLLYQHLSELIDHLHIEGFEVGIRTNGYLLDKQENIEIANACECSTGISIHSLDPVTNRMIMGRADIPDWDYIIPKIKRPRISVVLNRCNEFEFFDLLKFFSRYAASIRYVQVRRVSTDTRKKELAPDIAAYERVYTQVSRIFPRSRRFVTDAEEYQIYGLPVVFWRTVKTSVNSVNYFTDGTISDNYFVVEGYLNNYLKEGSE